MGVLYIALPLTEAMADLDRQGVPFPQIGGVARNPTVREIRAVCDALPGVTSKLSMSPTRKPSDRRSWYLDLQGPDGLGNLDAWTVVSVTDFAGDEDEPVSVSFHKGWPSLILVIARGLAATCGPLVIYPDTGDPPVVIGPDSSVHHLLATWSFTAEHAP